MENLTDFLQQWRMRNPLRTWRNQHAVSAFDAAAILGVGVQALTRWESGAAMPGESNLEAIGRMIGVKDIDCTWHAWRAEAQAWADIAGDETVTQ